MSSAKAEATFDPPLKAEDIWNGWTRNVSSVHDGLPGFIIHAFNVRVYPKWHGGTRSLCGVKIAETGMLTLDDDWEPGCIKCRNKLRKLGLMKPRS